MDQPGKDNGFAGAERGAAPYLDAAWQMMAAVLLGAALGWLMDRKFGSQPWGVVSGLGLGLGLGFWRLLQTLSRLGKRP